VAAFGEGSVDSRSISIISVFVATTIAGVVSALAMRARAKAIKASR
jgi:hypothetical protein